MQPQSPATKQADINELSNALQALDYAVSFLAVRTPPKADEARPHIAAFDLLCQFRAQTEAHWRAALESRPLAELAGDVAAAAPACAEPALQPVPQAAAVKPVEQAPTRRRRAPR